VLRRADPVGALGARPVRCRERPGSPAGGGSPATPRPRPTALSARRRRCF